LTGGVAHRRPARTARRIRRRRLRLAGLLIAVAAVAVARDDQLPASSTAVPRIEVVRREPPAANRGAGDLDPALAAALRRAAADAAGDGVELYVKSGRRSPEEQERLFREAIARHGSAQEAARWVATPERSAHVSGDAVDVGPAAATAWLSAHGAAYGLCQIYANEPWHYELRREATGQGCPPMYPDPTHDPRMR
jgi:LAS superfamily LD-carboxypeptidase LdcB